MTTRQENSCVVTDYIGQRAPDGSIKHRSIIRMMKHFKKMQDYVEASKTPCADCGLDDPIVMEFDHFPDCENKTKISNCRSYKRIDEELLKGEWVCANCHVRRTKSRKQLSPYG